MERQVIFRDRQEEQAADLNNIQLFADETFSHFLLDAITSERMFVGLGVTKKSATELTIAAGRLWDGAAGKVFRKDAAEDLSVFSLLPLADKKYLTLSAIGQTVETSLEPRDYIIDLASGQTEPRVVAMESARTVAVLVTSGLESSSPQKPEAPTGYTPIAQVLLDTSGVVSITLADNHKLMRLFEVYQRGLANEAWIAAATPKLSSLMSDIAALGALVKQLKGADRWGQLAAEIALLRDQLDLPATYTEYEADNYLTKEKSDTANAEYHALVQMGVRFPWAGETEQQFALFNPYDASVKNYGGMVLPAHEEEARMSLTGLAGSLPLAQYQYQTLKPRQCTRTIRRTTYSPTWMSCTNGWYSASISLGKVVEEVFEGTVPAGVTIGDSQYSEGRIVEESPGHTTTYGRTVTVHTWQETYTVIDSTEETINGCINAQTFLNSQNGWLTKVGLTFTAKGATGAVSMFIMDTINGLPNHHRTLGSATVQAADIKDASQETEFVFAQPVFLSPGTRYAIVLVTGGAHSVGLVEGTKYTQGTLFYSTDGEYFQGDFTKDLMLSLYFAKFGNPRTVVDLTPISLAEGIAVFDLLYRSIQPDATSLLFQYQPSGTGEWVPIEEGTADSLLGLPAMCRMRAIFNGSQDIMPSLDLSGSKFRVQRSGTSFKHISTQRTLITASDEIALILRLENWDTAKHTCVAKLLSGTNTIQGAYTDETLDDTTIRRTFKFVPAAPISTYKIQIEGTTTTALKCFHVAQRMDVAA